MDIPTDQVTASRSPLPRVQPVQGPWITVDDAYGAQVAERQQLLEHRPDDVLVRPETRLVEPLAAGLRHAFEAHPDFAVPDDGVRCPDGQLRPLRLDRILEDAASILQEDLCLLERRHDVHVLVSAVLCFPASWTLSEKIGRPLWQVHRTVDAYDQNIGGRVERLLSGLREDTPLWRSNLLRYEAPDLYQPRSEYAPARPEPEDGPWWRSERQTFVRLAPDLVLFAIHTRVVPA